MALEAVKELTLIQEANLQAQTILLIWDNHSAHLSALVEQTAKDLQIVLVNLPAYSPNQNPIERIWKHIKRTISQAGLIEHVKHLEHLIQSACKECSHNSRQVLDRKHLESSLCK